MSVPHRPASARLALPRFALVGWLVLAGCGGAGGSNPGPIDAMTGGGGRDGAVADGSGPGSAGATGSAGVSGSAGTTGSAGTSSAAGTTGAAGAFGAAGTTGAAGT